MMITAHTSNIIGLVVSVSVESIMKTDVTATTDKQHHMTKQNLAGEHKGTKSVSFSILQRQNFLF